MSDTPRTDAILGDIEKYSKHGLVHALGHTSRNLERELGVAQAKIAALDEQQKNEYICKCGLRVTPHRCKTGKEF